MSERFPKVLKDRSFVSTNSSDTAVSVTPQWEEAVTPATLAMLSSGEFVGVTADDPDIGMPLKGFHARIIREEVGLEKEKLSINKHPIDAGTLRQHFAAIRQDIAQFIEREAKKITANAANTGLVLK